MQSCHSLCSKSTSVALEFVISQATNTWVEELSITGWTYNETATVAGTYKVTYQVTDSQGASVTKTIKVTVKAASVKSDKENVSVETGDQTNVGLFIFLAIISSLGIAVLMIVKNLGEMKKNLLL